MYVAGSHGVMPYRQCSAPAAHLSPQTSFSEFGVACDPDGHRKGWSLPDNEPSMLTFCTNANRIHRITLYQKSRRQPILRQDQPKLVLSNIRNPFALQTHHVMMRLAVHLHVRRAVVQAHLAEHAALNKQMDIFVARS
jgi:hypothetical protein